MSSVGVNCQSQRKDYHEQRHTQQGNAGFPRCGFFARHGYFLFHMVSAVCLATSVETSHGPLSAGNEPRWLTTRYPMKGASLWTTRITGRTTICGDFLPFSDARVL